MCKIFIYIVLIEKERIYDKKWNNYFLPCRNHKLLVLVDVFCIIWQWFIVCLLPFIMYCFIWIQLYAICFIWQTSWIKPSISRNSKYIISRLTFWTHSNQWWWIGFLESMDIIESNLLNNFWSHQYKKLFKLCHNFW